jgi:hypothetical protein
MPAVKIFLELLLDKRDIQQNLPREVTGIGLSLSTRRGHKSEKQTYRI